MAIAGVQTHNHFAIEKSVKIDDVWVEQELRRKNICRRLFSQIVAHYKEINLFVLNYVDNNIEAEKTWKQLGFKPVIHYSANYIDRKLSKRKDDYIQV